MFFDRSSTTHVAFFIIISNAIIFLYRNYLVILVGVNFCGLILVKLLVVLILWFTFKYLWSDKVTIRIIKYFAPFPVCLRI